MLEQLRENNFKKPINNFLLEKHFINNNVERKPIFDPIWGKLQDKEPLFNEPKNFHLPKFVEFPPQPQLEVVWPDLDGLAWLVRNEPQKDPEGNLKYLLTSGMAVYVITGKPRPRHDIDLVLLSSLSREYATDNVTPKQYWANMSLDPIFLEKTAFQVSFLSKGNTYDIATVHPAIIAIQKLSNTFDRPPRDKDIKDVQHLVEFWLTQYNGDPRWRSIMTGAFAALPKEERERTLTRLSSLFPDLDFEDILTFLPQ